MSGSGMTNDIVALCLNVTIFGDDIVEGMEYINVSFTHSDNQASFVGPSQAQVRIIDNDGECIIGSVLFILILSLLSSFLIVRCIQIRTLHVICMLGFEFREAFWCLI
jgi:hypothetical protein